MGNLRSVSQAVLHAAAGSGFDVDRRRSGPTRCCAAERVVLPGQGAMRDCMRELRDSGLKEAVLRRRRQQAAAGRVRRHADAARPQRRAGHAGPGPDRRAACSASDLEGQLQPDGSRYKVPQMGWNRVRQQRRRTRCGTACPTTAGSISCTATTRRRPTPRTGRRRPTTARALPAPSHGITFLPPSSTPRRAPTHGLALYRNFLAWKP